MFYRFIKRKKLLRKNNKNNNEKESIQEPGFLFKRMGFSKNLGLDRNICPTVEVLVETPRRTLTVTSIVDAISDLQWLTTKLVNFT